MAIFTYRQLDDLHDPRRGQGTANFLSDLEAVAQCIQTRLLLFQGEWFEAMAVGLPLFQSILGVSSTSAGVSLIIRNRILGTPYVLNVDNVVISYDINNRIYTFSANVQTAFGTIFITTQPLPGNKATITS